MTYPPRTLSTRFPGDMLEPEIDLTDLDPECASSRLHAEVRQDGEGWLLVPCRTTNGTLLNGQWLEPGTP